MRRLIRFWVVVVIVSWAIVVGAHQCGSMCKNFASIRKQLCAGFNVSLHGCGMTDCADSLYRQFCLSGPSRSECIAIGANALTMTDGERRQWIRDCVKIDCDEENSPNCPGFWLGGS